MNMTQATHAGVGTTCNVCHEAGLSFYMGAASPGAAGPSGRSQFRSNVGAQRLQPLPHHGELEQHGAARRPHAEPRQSGVRGLPYGRARGLFDATLAANSVLHTGISSGCAQCHGGTSALTWYNNFTPKDAVLTPPHIPYLAGTDCGSCHSSSTYAVGTFGPMNMTQAKHAFVATTCNTCHEAGLSLLHGRGKSRAAGPSRGSQFGPDAGAERLQHLPHHGELEQHRAARGAHAEPGQPRLHCLPHQGAHRLYDRDAREQCGAAYRHQQRLHQLPRRPVGKRAGVLFELHAEVRGALTGAHPDQHHRMRVMPRGDGVHGVQRHHDDVGKTHRHVRRHRQDAAMPATTPSRRP